MTEIERLQAENERLRRDLEEAKRREAATWEHHSAGFKEFTSRALVLETALKRVCHEMLPEGMRTPHRMLELSEPWKTAGKALLPECQKERQPNTPIDELVRQYADECCNHYGR